MTANSNGETFNLLRSIFRDDRDILNLLDLRAFDIEGEFSPLVAERLQSEDLLIQPIGLRLTGRTSAGKTSLTRWLFAPELTEAFGLGESQVQSEKRAKIEQEMPSTGNQDCTDYIGFFELGSRMSVMDLPGAGSNEIYENINRAAMYLEQLYEEDITVDELEVRDFSKMKETGKVDTHSFTLQDWSDPKIRKEFPLDIILFLLTPHQQFARSERLYLTALLRKLSSESRDNKVIFVLNLHRTENGDFKHTLQNMEDVCKGVTKVYSKYYSDEPPIIEVDCKTGSGVNRLLEQLCRMLPTERIGNLQKVLEGELKKEAQAIIDRRYVDMITRMAARLSTYKVDGIKSSGGIELLEEAALAVAQFGSAIYYTRDAAVEAVQEDELSRLVDYQFCLVRDKSSEDNIVKIPVVETVEETRTIEVPVAKYRKPKVMKEQKPVYKIEEHTTLVNKRGLLPRLMRAIGSFIGDETLGTELHTDTYTVLSGTEEIETKKPRNPRIKMERTEVKIEVPKVFYKTEVRGKIYLMGGYPYIEFLLSLSLAIRSKHRADLDGTRSISELYRIYQDRVSLKLSPVKEEIEKLFSSENPDGNQLVKLLRSVNLDE